MDRARATRPEGGDEKGDGPVTEDRPVLLRWPFLPGHPANRGGETGSHAGISMPQKPRPVKSGAPSLLGAGDGHVGLAPRSSERILGPASLSRPLRGERGLSIAAFDILGKHLGLRLVRDED